ncbi:PREDICTED: T-cell leukemia/lymphoma protein 1A-like [Myotis davidii]|uniref:T-cell leukemia/lymphoma protein 1A-like n=1 Tax=Myotis davidii TaxID=225400 RepID=UPI0003EC584A|nr:PREDICTED: T-cell leukemia/lymphoma protein 1A-like [Myotis davidii]
MAELPLKVHLNSHPICLRICLHSFYENQKQCTWLHVVMETEGVLQVRLRQEVIPSGHISLTNSPLSSRIMSFMWKLQPGGPYVDHLNRFWRNLHHIKNGVEEMILELMEDS